MSIEIDQKVYQSEARFFDQMLASDGDFNPFADRGMETLRRRFVRHIAGRATQDLLDVGCGTGTSRQIYRASVGHYTGIDLSPQSIDYATRRFPADAWQTANACALPFRDESFDVVAFSSVLHHIPDFRPALTEARRVLRPGGTVFAFDPNLLHPAMLLFRCPSSPLYSPKGVSPNERPLTAGQLRRGFAAAGLDVPWQRAESDLPYRHVAPKLLNSLLKFYNATDWVWQRTGLGRWFGTFVITVGRKAG